MKTKTQQASRINLKNSRAHTISAKVETAPGVQVLDLPQGMLVLFTGKLGEAVDRLCIKQGITVGELLNRAIRG